MCTRTAVSATLLVAAASAFHPPAVRRFAVLVPRQMQHLASENACFFLCDVQERFRPLIYRMSTVISSSRLLLDASRVLGVPVVATEQYSRAFGQTVPELGIANADTAGIYTYTHGPCIV
jgi:hypothetical protein